MKLATIFATLAVCACRSTPPKPQPDAGDPDQGPRNLFARFITTGGTCPEGASGYFAIQHAATGSGSAEVVPCTSLDACAPSNAATPPCPNGAPCMGYDSTMMLLGPTSAATTITSATCGMNPECGCTQGLVTYVDNHADMTSADEVSISLASARDTFTPCPTQADTTWLKDQTPSCILDGRIAASAPDISAVVPPQLGVQACTSEIQLAGNHFRPGLVVGYDSEQCPGGSFALDDSHGQYCNVPVDSVTWTTITFHFDVCPSSGTYALAVMNPDHQVGYASLTVQ